MGDLATASVLGDHPGWFGHMHGWDGGWMWLWGSVMMLTWVAIIGAAVYLFTRPFQAGRSTPGGARDILDERFARGEIDLDEYRDRLTGLHGDRSGRRGRNAPGQNAER